MYAKIRKLFTDLASYFLSNKFVPNLRKSKPMFFSSKPKTDLNDLSFGGQIIEWVSEFKYLGLVWNNRVTYSSHIDRIYTKVS